MVTSSRRPRCFLAVTRAAHWPVIRGGECANRGPLRTLKPPWTSIRAVFLGFFGANSPAPVPPTCGGTRRTLSSGPARWQDPRGRRHRLARPRRPPWTGGHDRQPPNRCSVGVLFGDGPCGSFGPIGKSVLSISFSPRLAMAFDVVRVDGPGDHHAQHYHEEIRDIALRARGAVL
jgi:hypothetical protein